MPEVFPYQEKDVLFAALNSMVEALVVYDLNGHLQACNKAFLEMYNYTAEQARPGVHFRELGEIDIRQGNVVVEDEAGENYLDRKAEYRQRLEGSFTVKLQDGRWIRTTDRAMPGGGFVSVHVDVSELKLAQEKMQLARLVAQQHEKELAILNESLEVQVADRTQKLLLAKLEAEQQARTDPLTGLRNRRAFFESAKAIHQAAIRFVEPYSVIMIDIDEFKQVNDSHGHMAGDEVLRALAISVEKVSRSIDISGRIGGDEFSVVLPKTPSEKVIALAKRLSVSFSDLSKNLGCKDLEATVSIGIAELNAGDSGIEGALSRADRALYEAKDRGRNQVLIA